MMRQILALLFVSTTGLIGIARAQKPPHKQQKSVEAVKQEVLQFEATRNRELVKGDTKALAGMYADGLIWTNPRGARLTKDQILAEMRSGTEKFIAIHHKDKQVRVYGDTAVLNAYTTSTVRYKGVSSNYPRRFTNVYIKRNGHWLLIVHQATPVLADRSAE
ncbi:MAG: nuclear transport factor 2 family protein [Terriglobia bacterium]